MDVSKLHETVSRILRQRQRLTGTAETTTKAEPGPTSGMFNPSSSKRSEDFSYEVEWWLFHDINQYAVNRFPVAIMIPV